MMRGLTKLKRAGNWVKRRFLPKCLILLYHRIAEQSNDPWNLCVSPQHFQEHLEVLKNHFPTLSLTRLTRVIRDGHMKEGVSITFDDGYSDNLREAKPLLERFDVPAMVFVTSGYTGKNREFWWDELEGIVMKSAPLPNSLLLRINDETYTFGPVELTLHQETAPGFVYCGSIEDSATGKGRVEFYRKLCEILRLLPEECQKEQLDSIATWACSHRNPRNANLPLTGEEITRLVSSGLIDVGAHTVTHPVLGTSCVATQQAEIQTSKIELEALLGRPVQHFAYPYGGPAHVTKQTVYLVRQAGFLSACTINSALVTANTDVYELPRLYVLNWNGEQFARELWSWF